MAQISIEELLEIIMKHPDYETKWKKEVPANQALYISFSNTNASELNSINYSTSDGYELIIDVDSKSTVFGIEIL